MNHKSQNRLAILRRYMDAWAGLPRHSRSLVGEIILEKFAEMGLKEHIAGTGVEFTHTDDLCHEMRTHAQKLWRWLGGFEECKPQPDKLWYIEQAIVAALPEGLRIQYLSEVYRHSDLCIAGRQDAAATDPAKMIQTLIKENSEAQIAVSSLGPNSTSEEREQVLRELRESESATRAAIEALEKGGK